MSSNGIFPGRIFSMHRLHVKNNPISGHVDVYTCHAENRKSSPHGIRAHVHNINIMQ